MSSIFNDGVLRIQIEDSDVQRKFLKTLSKVRFMDVEYLLKLGCFFVPNKDYLVHMFGPDCIAPECGFYNYDGSCKFLGNLMIPIRSVEDDIVGFTSFNLEAHFADYELNFPKYVVSDKSVFNKNRFMLIPNGYKKMLEEGYCIIVDGNFDGLTLASMGLNSCCVLGSSISDYIIFLLSFIPNRYVARDNDLAGLRLFNSINSKLPGTRSLLQGSTKDIDEFLQDESKREKVRDLIFSKLSSDVKTDIILK